MQHRKTEQVENMKGRLREMESRMIRSTNNVIEVPEGEKIVRKSQDLMKFV